jgi:hypothetical protein
VSESCTPPDEDSSGASPTQAASRRPEPGPAAGRGIELELGGHATPSGPWSRPDRTAVGDGLNPASAHAVLAEEGIAHTSPQMSPQLAFPPIRRYVSCQGLIRSNAALAARTSASA